MGSSRIEQSIEDIYDFIEGCKIVPLSSAKVVVQKDQLYDLLDELRMRVPDEVKRYKKVITNREAILEDAQKKADEILRDSKEKTASLINESEIVQQAYFQANQIVTQATEEANRIMAKAAAESEQIRMSALSYTNDLLADAENVLTNAYNSTKERYEGLTTTLKYGLDTIQNNRTELGLSKERSTEPGQPEYPQDEYSGEELPQVDYEEFTFDEDTFLEDVK